MTKIINDRAIGYEDGAYAAEAAIEYWEGPPTSNTNRLREYSDGFVAGLRDSLDIPDEALLKLAKMRGRIK